MSTEEILKEFKKTLISFFDELIEQFPSEGSLIFLRIYLNDQICIKEVMDNFIVKINKNNEELLNIIENRNDIYFLENNVFEINKQTFNKLKKIWCTGLDKEDKNLIWKWIDSFVYFAKKYSNLNSTINENEEENEETINIYDETQESENEENI